MIDSPKLPLLTAGLASFIIPIYELSFDILTDVRLLELSNADLPLLRRLAIEVLDEGIRLYPRAAALTMWKGAVTMQFGELALGRRYKADALRIARENLDQGIGNPRENFEVVEALSRD